jgi:hypothetical protein
VLAELGREEEEEKSALRFMLEEVIKSHQIEFTIPDLENAQVNGEKFSRGQSDKTLYRLVKDGKVKKRGNRYSIAEFHSILKDNIDNIEEFIERILKKNGKNS